MQKFLPDNAYKLIEMDTDSSYFALSTKSLEEAVRPEIRDEFYASYRDWFPSPACDEHYDKFVEVKTARREWTPLSCCKARSKHDKRTPGLFKTEFEGTGAVALCSKTYICWNDRETKISCKGIQKARNIANLTRENYKRVIKSQTPGKGINKGFRSVDGVMYTYEQERAGLSYFYGKRQVLADGTSTIPLDL